MKNPSKNSQGVYLDVILVSLVCSRAKLYFRWEKNMQVLFSFTEGELDR
jgi:hypothetical protein